MPKDTLSSGVGEGEEVGRPAMTCTPLKAVKTLSRFHILYT